MILQVDLKYDCSDAALIEDTKMFLAAWGAGAVVVGSTKGECRVCCAHSKASGEGDR